MRRNSIVSSIVTYFIIIFLVIGINLFSFIPLINTTHQIESLKVIKDSSMPKYLELYGSYCRSFSNMTVALLAIISLFLVVIGLILRVTKANNKGIYNAVILSGITSIFYLIYFIIAVSNTFVVLF